MQGCRKGLVVGATEQRRCHSGATVLQRRPPAGGTRSGTSAQLPTRLELGADPGGVVGGGDAAKEGQKHLLQTQVGGARAASRGYRGERQRTMAAPPALGATGPERPSQAIGRPARRAIPRAQQPRSSQANHQELKQSAVLGQGMLTHGSNIPPLEPPLCPLTHSPAAAWGTWSPGRPQPRQGRALGRPPPGLPRGCAPRAAATCRSGGAEEAAASGQSFCGHTPRGGTALCGQATVPLSGPVHTHSGMG